MRLQRRYLEGLIDDIDDADDEYWLICVVDAVDVYLACMRTSSSQDVQSLVSASRLILTKGKASKFTYRLISPLGKVYNVVAHI